MKVGEQILMDKELCEVVCITEQGFVLEPIKDENLTSRLEDECKRLKTRPGQFLNCYI